MAMPLARRTICISMFFSLLRFWVYWAAKARKGEETDAIPRTDTNGVGAIPGARYPLASSSSTAILLDLSLLYLVLSGNWKCHFNAPDYDEAISHHLARDGDVHDALALPSKAKAEPPAPGSKALAKGDVTERRMDGHHRLDSERRRPLRDVESGRVGGWATRMDLELE